MEVLAGDDLQLSPGYDSVVKQIWTGPMARAVGKYGENVPMATVCCNACRNCVTTNIVGVVMAGTAGAGYAVANFARRRFSQAP
jgi:hypothetical protein